MSGKWNRYWSMQAGQIQQGFSQWRKSGHARVQLQNLRSITNRADLYSCVTVTVHGPNSNVGGKQHMLDLARVVAPMVRPGESVKVCIVRDGNNDYLEFS